MLALSANVNNNIPGVAPNDLYLDDDGNIVMATDIQAALQACAEAAKTLLGEMVLNTDQGIPYFQTVWVGVPNVQQFNAALRAAFLAVPNVIEVVSLITSQQNNTLQYTAIIRTSFGAGNLTNQIVAGGII
jgi:enamine deaminase RidA (YjgF/YER057c/UK114 family)